jgi:hypothetical protein
LYLSQSQAALSVPPLPCHAGSKQTGNNVPIKMDSINEKQYMKRSIIQKDEFWIHADEALV